MRRMISTNFHSRAYNNIVLHICRMYILIITIILFAVYKNRLFAVISRSGGRKVCTNQSVTSSTNYRISEYEQCWSNLPIRPREREKRERLKKEDIMELKKFIAVSFFFLLAAKVV